MVQQKFNFGFLVTVLVVVVLATIDFGVAAPTNPQAVDAAKKVLIGADGLYRRELYDMASQEYADFLTKYPNHAQATTARYAYAICQYRLKKYDKTIPLIIETMKDQEFDKRDEALAVLGHAYLSTSQHDKALLTLDQLLGQFPKSSHTEVATLNRGQVLYLLNKKAEAMIACQQFLDKYPKSHKAIEARYLMALAQSSLGQKKEAIKTLTALLKEHSVFPQRVDAVLLLGQCYESQNQFTQAIAQYQNITKTAPDSRKADGYYSLGVAYNRAGKRDDAIAALSVVLKKYPKSHYVSPAKLQLGLAQLATNRMDAARKTFSEIVAKDKARASMATYYLAQCDFTEKKYDAARKRLESLMKIKPVPTNIADIVYDRARCTFAMNQFELAVGQFNEFITRFPKDQRAGHATYRQAFSLHKMGQYDKSLVACRTLKKLAANQKIAEAIDLEAENLFLLKQYKETAKLIEPVLKTSNGERKRRLTLRYGQCAYFSKEYDKAIAVFKPMLKDPQLDKDTNLQRGVFLLGDAQLHAGQYKAAVGSLSRYLAVASRDFEEAQFKLALAYQRNNDPASAGKIFEELTRGKPDHPWVHRGLFEYAQLLYKTRKQDQAAPLFKQVLATDGPVELKAPSHYMLAWIDADAKRYEQAATAFGAMIKKYPKDKLVPDATYFQGALLRQANQYDPAIKVLKQFIQSYPNAKQVNQAWYLVGVCYSRLNKYDDAIAVFVQQLKKQEAITESLIYELAWAYRAKKEIDKAIASYQLVLKKYPQGKLVTTTQAELAELLYGKKQYAQAVALLEKVLAKKGTEAKLINSSQFRLAWCYSKLSQHDKAASAFIAFIKTSKDDKLIPSALYQAGMAYASLARHGDAEKQFVALIGKYPSHEVTSIAFLKLGEVQAGANQFDKSKATYLAYLKKYPKAKYHYLAHFGIGWAFENSKKYDDARKWYAKVIEAHNGPTAARAQFQTGETWFAQGDFEKATRELLKVDIVYGYPQWSAKALYEAGRAFEQLGLKDKAKAQYQLCSTKFKDQKVTELAKKALGRLKASG